MLHIAGRFQRRLQDEGNQLCHCCLINGMQFSCAFPGAKQVHLWKNFSLFIHLPNSGWDSLGSVVTGYFHSRAFRDYLLFNGKNFRSEISFWKGEGSARDALKCLTATKGLGKIHQDMSFLATNSSLATALLSGGFAYPVPKRALNMPGSVLKIRSPAMDEFWNKFLLLKPYIQGARHPGNVPCILPIWTGLNLQWPRLSPRILKMLLDRRQFQSWQMGTIWHTLSITLHFWDIYTNLGVVQDSSALPPPHCRQLGLPELPFQIQASSLLISHWWRCTSYKS